MLKIAMSCKPAKAQMLRLASGKPEAAVLVLYRRAAFIMQAKWLGDLVCCEVNSQGFVVFNEAASQQKEQQKQPEVFLTGGELPQSVCRTALLWHLVCYCIRSCLRPYLLG